MQSLAQMFVWCVDRQALASSRCFDWSMSIDLRPAGVGIYLSREYRMALRYNTAIHVVFHS